MIRLIKNLIPRRLRRLISDLLSKDNTLRYELAWRGHRKLMRLKPRRTTSSEERDRQIQQFQSSGYLQGQFPADDTERVAQLLAQHQPADWRSDDCVTGYVAGQEIHQYAETYNTSIQHLVLDEATRQEIEQLLSPVSDLVADCLGHSWRIVNFLCRRTLPTASEVGPLAWHNDGWPRSLVKILVYFTPPGSETGTTELDLSEGVVHQIQGAAGTWFLFRNSELTHRGIRPTSQPRVSIEVTIAPCWTTRPFPEFAGLNAQYPKYPWVRRPQRPSKPVPQVADAIDSAPSS
jgi:hypothetical protein